MFSIKRSAFGIFGKIGFLLVALLILLVLCMEHSSHCLNHSLRRIIGYSYLSHFRSYSTLRKKLFPKCIIKGYRKFVQFFPRYPCFSCLFLHFFCYFGMHQKKKALLKLSGRLLWGGLAKNTLCGSFRSNPPNSGYFPSPSD